MEDKEEREIINRELDGCVKNTELVERQIDEMIEQFRIMQEEMDDVNMEKQVGKMNLEEYTVHKANTQPNELAPWLIISGVKKEWREDDN